MPYVGLHIDGDSVHLALIKKRGGKIEIDTEKTIATHDALLSEDIIGKKVEVTSGLSPSDVIIRNFDIPLAKKRALNAAMPFQLETHVPLPLSESILLPKLHTLDSSSTRVNVIGCHKQNLHRHLLKLEDMGVSANWVSSYPNALKRYAQHFYPTLSSYIALYIGLYQTYLIAVHEGKLWASTSIEMGIKNLKNPADEQKIKAVKIKFKSDLDRSITFLKSKCKAVLHWDFLCCGYVDQIFEENDLSDLEIPSRAQSIDQAHAPYAIAIGLALDTAHQDSATVQFREGNFISSKHLASLGKRLCASFFLSALIALLSFATMSALINRKEYALEKRLNTFIENWSSADKLQASEFALGHDCKRSLRIDHKISHLKKKLREQASFFPVYLDVPSVSELLTHLSHHPIFGNQQHDIDIQSLHYELESYPCLKSLSTPYRAKVRMNLVIPSSASATLLHDALKAGDALIDGAGGVEFHRNSTGYCAQCYLQSSKRRKRK